MSKASRLAAMYGLLAYTASTGGNPIYDVEEDSNELCEKTPKPPKGCKEYFFDKDGNIVECDESHGDDSVVIFKCWAINDKNAIRKYQKFSKRL